MYKHINKCSIKRYLLLTVIILLYGCKSTTNIRSNPPGADFYVDNVRQCVTPCVYTDPSFSTSPKKVTLKKVGYDDLSSTITRRLLGYPEQYNFHLTLKAVPDRIMEFEEGMKAIGENLAAQIEDCGLRSQDTSKTSHQQLKRITLDPFIDAESGYPVKVNSRIKEIMTEVIGNRFEITGEMEPETLEKSDYVLNGMVTLEQVRDSRKKAHKVYATVFDKTKGVVLASTSLFVNSFDTTPKDIYKDSAVFLKGKNHEDHLNSTRKNRDETVSSDYQERLKLKAMLVKGDMLYEQREFKKSLAYYNQAAGGKDTAQLEVLNGQFTNLIKQGQFEEAEKVYAKLLRASVAESSEIANKIVFAPNSKVPVENKKDLYNIYLNQIAQLVASVPDCKVKIVGHCSKTGTETYNDKLSLQRAQWIQKEISAYAPEAKLRTEAVGRGFRENLVGNGRDDLTDEIDRRVEFRFNGCGG